MTKSTLPTLAAAALWLAPSVQAAGVAVYEQPFVEDLGGFAADGEPKQFFSQQLADNFSLSSDTMVGGISWVGASENFFFSDLTNFSAFVIEIYDGVGDIPSDVLLSLTVPIEETNPEFLEVSQFTLSEIHAFEVNFEPIELAAGPYWISVGSINANPVGDSFRWALSEKGGEGLFAQRFWNGDGWQNNGPADFTFGILAPNACPADLSGDGSVGFNDLTLLLESWGTCAGCPADLSGDSSVGFGDLTLLLKQWGTCQNT